jgi:NADH-quinone oxidoreductase subunit E
MNSDLEMANKVIEKYHADKDMLIQILLELQSNLGWLPQEVLGETQKKLGVPLTRVYQVATFYKAFRLTPRGKYMIEVCTGTACQVRGSRFILDTLQQLLGIRPGETTPDMKFSLETVNCLGCCAMGPVAVVNGAYYGPLTAYNISELLMKCE